MKTTYFKLKRVHQIELEFDAITKLNIFANFVDGFCLSSELANILRRAIDWYANKLLSFKRQSKAYIRV